MQPALFDSSIYITALRRGGDAVLALRRFTIDAPLWLSAVVLEELYAGAADRDRQIVERLERDFDRAKRILVPNLSDWTQAGAECLLAWRPSIITKRSGRDQLRTDRRERGATGRAGDHSQPTRFQEVRRVSRLSVPSDGALVHVRR